LDAAFTIWCVFSIVRPISGQYSPSLARQKLLNWHGVAEARIYRDQSVHGEREHKTPLIKLLSPLLLYAPDGHLRTLEKMCVDGTMHGPVWHESIKKLNEEWQEFILYVSRQLCGGRWISLLK
jgi:hypothetical protein